MTKICMICQPDYEPRSPKLWARVFPHVGEDGNQVQVFHDWLSIRDSDGIIVAAPFKNTDGTIKNFIYQGKKHNTDYWGFLHVKPWIPFDARIVVIGAGALGQTVLAALTDQGYQNLYIWNRTAQKAHKAATEYNCFICPDLNLRWFEHVINCVPSVEINADYLIDNYNKTTNLVWGKDADELALWQAAYAQHLVWNQFGVEQFYQWMKEDRR